MAALKRVWHLGKLGNCPTGEIIRHQDMHRYRNDDTDFNQQSIQELVKHLGDEFVFQSLAEIRRDYIGSYATGDLLAPFRLRVTRDGCNYDGLIRPTRENPGDQNTDETIGELLTRWYEHADVSGYGDVRAQQTVVNSDIRNAREIAASEFSVEPELLVRIQTCWEGQFLWHSGVRVEPYKIHLYGPGGHFKTHRDTPQNDLVGTFLLGLGDTTGERCFAIASIRTSAHPGSWCAFYPDVPHSVTTVSEGYRAVIAFKVFRTGTAHESQQAADVPKAVADVLGKLRTPYGILLERQYSLGTTQLSGFDALLLAGARARSDVDVRLLPVVIESSAEWGSESRHDPDGDFEQECRSSIFPFTEDHVDFALKRCTQDDLAAKYPWLRGLKNVPFYSVDFDESVVVWKDQTDETCNYVGNEAQAWRQDSVYLSYALLVLPKTV